MSIIKDKFIDTTSNYSSSLLKKYRGFISKIYGKRKHRERLGKILECAAEIALREIGVSYSDYTDEFHDGHHPEFSTITTEIECKNWEGATKGRYRVGINRVKTQIFSRFDFSNSKKKVLICPTNMVWDSPARLEVLSRGIIVIEVPLVTNISDIPRVVRIIQPQLVCLCRIDMNDMYSVKQCSMLDYVDGFPVREITMIASV